MDLIKQLTGKNPSEYETVAKSLVDNSDTELFKKLVKQDDFLFDFIKTNVANRIKNACNENNYLNLMKFFDIYSESYASMIVQVLFSYEGENLLPVMKEFFLKGTNSEKAYAVKYFSLLEKDKIVELLPEVRKTAKSDCEQLSFNSIELLSILGDEISKTEAVKNLKSEDEFVQYDAVKFLVNYQAVDTIDDIIEVMRKSSFSENIASEIPYLLSLDELLSSNRENAILVLCNITNAIPEIISPVAILDYDLLSVFQSLISGTISSAEAVLLRLAKDKFEELVSNDEYLFDCDKNTKDAVTQINNLLAQLNERKLESLLYDELYDGSDFVFFALDYVNEAEELETLLDSENQTLILKVLSVMKDKNILKPGYKSLALDHVANDDLKKIIEVL